jgi:hypothetical protein
MKRLDEIFDLWYGVNLEFVNCEQVEKGIPFVSRQSSGNGVVGYVMPVDIVPNPAHTLSIAGSGSVLSTFYHDYEYYSGRDVYIAKPKQSLTKEQMIYYACVIEQNKYRYSFGRQANKTLKNILIPDISELPDYVNKISVSDYTFEKKPVNDEKTELNTESWQWFNLNDLFRIYASNEKNARNRAEGATPFISSTQFTNGVSKYVDDTPTQPVNTITVARNGSVCSAFYQPIPYCASPDDVRIFEPKFRLNKYIAFFLLPIIEKEKFRYEYGRKFGTKRMNQTKIKLPVTNDNKPDWQFMEDYIKSLPYSDNI